MCGAYPHHSMASVRGFAAAPSKKQDEEEYEEDSGSDEEGQNLAGSQTLDKMRDLFSRQCQTALRYEMFADRADLEGFLGVGDSLRALARSERIQAQQLFKVVEDTAQFDVTNELYTGHTEDNLFSALGKEGDSLKDQYIEAAKVAFDDDISFISEMLYEFSEAEDRKRSILQNSLADIQKLRGTDKQTRDEEDSFF